MRKIVDLPDSLYRKSEALAASRGATVEQFIVEAVKREVQGSLGSDTAVLCGELEKELPVIRSKRPGTLDLTNFDFDGLLTNKHASAGSVKIIWKSIVQAALEHLHLERRSLPWRP